MEKVGSGTSCLQEEVRRSKRSARSLPSWLSPRMAYWPNTVPTLRLSRPGYSSCP
jgi:hypothetical protein